MKSTPLPILAILMWSAGWTVAADRVDYVKQVKPILAQKCYACHGALKQESGLRLDAASLVLQGGDSGPSLVAGKANESLLMERIRSDEPDERMPPEGEGEPLTPSQIALLRTWIDQGAQAPPEPVPSDPRKHWAYQEPVRRPVAQVADAGWLRNDIDALIAAKHKQSALSPSVSASPEVLLRRVYLDLIGLPPTRQQLRSFLADNSPRAYEKVVDQLLDSKLYGQRWARHWMDVWRYSDWAGFGNQIRYSQRHIWRWRDWIVESLNADKGYDRMIVEMLAGDELAPDDADILRATGFLARNWYKFDRNSWLDDTIEHTAKAFLATTIQCARCHDHKYDPISQQEYYQFRAIFEPYGVRTDRLPAQLDVNKDGLVRVYDAEPDAATYLFVRGDPKCPDQDHPLPPGVPSVMGKMDFEVRPISLPVEGYYPALREFVGREMIRQRKSAVAAAEAALAKSADNLLVAEESKSAPARALAEQDVALAEKTLTTARAQLAAVEARLAAERAKYQPGPYSGQPSPIAGTSPATADLQSLASAAGQAERDATLAEAEENLFKAEYELQRARAADAQGDAQGKKEKAVGEAEKKVADAQKALDIARRAADSQDASYQPLGEQYAKTSSGRRLALARWITERRHPLTARVAVNHIWMRHFGTPLVENVVDFGLRSPRPAHADLLDHLAIQLMDDDWRMKKLHRLIVTSATYRMSSKWRDNPTDNAATDPDNLLLWRMNSRRMEAETVRDSILHVAGSLDTQAGGPDIDHNQGLTSPRRSLYFRHAREKQMQLLAMFDAANPRECYRRMESIRPQQAFALINSSLTLAQSRLLARRLAQDGKSGKTTEGDKPVGEEDFIVAAFETVLSRAPSQEELAECRQFLAFQAEQLSQPSQLQLLSAAANAVPASKDPQQRARENLVLVLFNHNDFVTIR